MNTYLNGTPTRIQRGSTAYDSINCLEGNEEAFSTRDGACSTGDETLVCIFK